MNKGLFEAILVFYFQNLFAMQFLRFVFSVAFKNSKTLLEEVSKTVFKHETWIFVNCTLHSSQKNHKIMIYMWV